LNLNFEWWSEWYAPVYSSHLSGPFCAQRGTSSKLQWPMQLSTSKKVK
jgi:hypothetical protein